MEEILESNAEEKNNIRSRTHLWKDKEKRDLVKHVEENEGLLLPSGCEDLDSFVKDLRSLKNNQDDYERLRGQARIIDEYIMAWTLEHTFEKARWTLLPMSFSAALLLITFAWAANPPKPVPGPQVIVEQFP